MAVDTLAKRMAVAHLKRYPAKGVLPGGGDSLERAAIAWSYASMFTPPTPGTARTTEIGIGQKKSFSTDTILGGGGSW